MEWNKTVWSDSLLKKTCLRLEATFGIRFVWIAGHRGIKGNDIADKVAKIMTNPNGPIKPYTIAFLI